MGARKQCTHTHTQARTHTHLRRSNKYARRALKRLQSAPRARPASVHPVPLLVPALRARRARVVLRAAFVVEQKRVPLGVSAHGAATGPKTVRVEEPRRARQRAVAAQQARNLADGAGSAVRGSRAVLHPSQRTRRAPGRAAGGGRVRPRPARQAHQLSHLVDTDVLASFAPRRRRAGWARRPLPQPQRVRAVRASTRARAHEPGQPAPHPAPTLPCCRALLRAKIRQRLHCCSHALHRPPSSSPSRCRGRDAQHAPKRRPLLRARARTGARRVLTTRAVQAERLCRCRLVLSRRAVFAKALAG